MQNTLWQWFNRARAVVLAIAVHVIVLGIIAINLEWSSDKPKSLQTAQVVKAQAVDPQQVKKELERIKQEELKKKQALERERKKIEREKKRLAEAEKKRKADELKRKQLAKKKAEEKKRREEAARKKREQEKKLAEQKRQKEIERKKREKEAQVRREKELQAAIEAEETENLIEHYASLINQHVQDRWDVPPDASIKIGMTCLVSVKLLPSGDILSMSIKQSSGNKVFDDAAVKAVQRAEPLPLPPAKENLFNEFRDITIPFVLKSKKT